MTELSKKLPLLPLTWSTVRVDEVFVIQQGKQVSKKNRIGNNQRPFLRTRNVFWGRLDLSNLDHMHFSASDEVRLALKKGDLLLCEGGDVGRTAVWQNQIPLCYYQNHLHRLRVAKEQIDPEFALYWFWYAFELSNIYIGRKNVTTIPNMSKSRLAELPMPKPLLSEQQKIAALLLAVQRAFEQQERLIALTTELKKALMHKLFTEGTRGEMQKQTEIGPVPESWEVVSIGDTCYIMASSMTYKQLEQAENLFDGVEVMGVKVSDMNIGGNEIEFCTANLKRNIKYNEAQKRTVPADVIIFPKRGAAIATNKKRLTTTWTVLDPNLIAVRPHEGTYYRYLYHWFKTFDLARITDPGPTPQLNKKDVSPLKYPKPDETTQKGISDIIDTVDQKIGNHVELKLLLNELFLTLLHQLMTAQIRVNDLDLTELDYEPIATGEVEVS